MPCRGFRLCLFPCPAGLGAKPVPPFVSIVVGFFIGSAYSGGVCKKRQARTSPQPPAPQRKNFFCPNRGLSGFVATLQGFVCFPDVACVCAFSRALRGWGRKHFHPSFPSLVGFFLVHFLIHRGLQKKIFLWGAGCRGCPQGRQGSRQGSRSHHHPTPPKAGRADTSTHPTPPRTQPHHPRQAGQEMEPPPHPPPKAGKADTTKTPSPQSAPSSLKRAPIKGAPPALPQIHPSPHLYTKPAYQNEKGLLAGFNSCTHHPKQTTTPQIKPAERAKAGRQASIKPTPPEARRAKQGTRGRHTLNPKQQHTPPAI